MKKRVTVALVQESPCHNDLSATMEKTLAFIDDAAGRGANLIAFGETWLTGYPGWIDHYPHAASWGNETMKEVYALMHANSIRVPGPETRQIGDYARRHGVTICIGANETVDSGRGNGTIYNAILLFDENGILVNHHRKLVPTFNEKLLYGPGDGAGLKTVETGCGRIGALVCWEHWMPPARQALHECGEQIHIALWPTVHDVHQLASRHYAFEGRCFVVAVGQIMESSDVPRSLQMPRNLSEPHTRILNGGSCVIGPNGVYLLEPQLGSRGTLLCTIEDLDATLRERLTLDIAGHYSRPDVFSFSWKKERA
ncbi:MAG: carbon-nitrogen hydrolase family protein [Chitinivibrionales bacterium]|nr:carbon-nitrogen hydrolase family protein [Chitinivibrionales bacterium]